MMRASASISPAHPLIREYHRSLAALRSQGVEHELGLRRPFENLLAGAARLRGWQYVAESGAKAGGHSIRPDGTVFDPNNFPRGFWESKDSHDDLEREIDRKLRRGYPDSNIIFEDTRRAVLYQNHGKTLDADLSDARDIPNLLNLFYEHTEPAIHEFEQAVEEFGKHRLGNRSALEWVVDQYRVTEDERSGIRSDPNREDDPQYIVRLVGQVVRVSVETVRIVRGLPEVF